MPIPLSVVRRHSFGEVNCMNGKVYEYTKWKELEVETSRGVFILTFDSFRGVWYRSNEHPIY